LLKIEQLVIKVRQLIRYGFTLKYRLLLGERRGSQSFLFALSERRFSGFRGFCLVFRGNGEV